MQSALWLFSQAVFTNYLLPSDHQLLADVLFKLPTLDQLFRPNEQDEGAVGAAEHTVDLVNADVAVLRCFSGGQRHFARWKVERAIWSKSADLAPST